ncbi:MAG: tetratricopeptide repeat protein [Marinifilaceae bacterium]
MRKLSLISLLLFCASVSFAQKGKVAQANSYFTSGKLDEAKKLIDQAMEHESCADYINGYFAKGQIYQAIFESPIQDYKKLDQNALDKAWDAFQQVIRLDEKNKFGKKLQTQYQNLVVDYTNKAIEFYNAENFKSALGSFKKVLEIQNSPITVGDGVAKIDTAVIFNAGVAAQRAGDFADAEKFYKETLKYNYEPARTYAMVANVLKEQGKNDEAIEYLHKGYELYPDNSYMIVELINYYLTGGEPEKAEKYLDAAIKQDPKNASYYRAKGNLYEKMKEMEKAEQMYRQTLEIDPKDFIAQFNIGNIKLTELNDFHKKVLDIVDVNEYTNEMKKVFDGYIAVVPLFERALELNPAEPNTMSILKELYFRLRNQDPVYQQKYDEIQAKLNK